ncbi:hypothetical protein JTB14_010283 [Gonioctena quinquepunctata]|nr:hypothetical protein JTB14_010283 [Gonioctena quinquepunctata]
MQWLKSAIENIKPWEGAHLRVVEEAEMPHNEILVAWKPGILHGENPWINRGSKRKPQCNELEGPPELLTLSVDHQSVERLRETGFVMNYEFGHTTLRPKSGKPKGVTLDPTSEPGTSGIEENAVSSKEQAGKPAVSAKPAKNVQHPSRGKQVPQTEGKARVWRGMRKEKQKAPKTSPTK